MSKLVDHTGKKFGRLTVIERAENSPNGRSRWLCRCDCGNETTVYGSILSNGRTKSCGCLRKDAMVARRIPIIDRLHNKKYLGCRWSAKAMGRLFDLTREECRELASSPCVYCGAPADPINGIDRVDNSIGYTFSNCVPCCWLCNQWKKARSVDEFLNHIKKIYEHSGGA